MLKSELFKMFSNVKVNREFVNINILYRYCTSFLIFGELWGRLWVPLPLFQIPTVVGHGLIDNFQE